MMAYWVYENYPNNRATVHKAECSYCNNGAGVHGVGKNPTGQWHGPYHDVIQAQAKARNTSRSNVRDCKTGAP